MKENIAKIAGEHITIEGNGDYEKAPGSFRKKALLSLPCTKTSTEL